MFGKGTILYFVVVASLVLSIVGAGAGQVFHGAVVRGTLLLLGTLAGAC